MAGGEEKRKGHERPADEAYEKKNTLNNLYLIAYLKMKKKKENIFPPTTTLARVFDKS